MVFMRIRSLRRMRLSDFAFRICLSLLLFIGGASRVVSQLPLKKYGICAHISRYNIDWKNRDRILKMMEDVGIDYVRTDFDWSQLQPSAENPNFDFRILDSLMISIGKTGRQVLPILDYSTKGASPSWRYLDKWTNYVSAVVKRYSSVPVWEVWNEMNLSGFWQDSPSAGNYLSLLKTTYQTIKKIDPNKRVMLGGMAGMDEKYLSELCRLGGTDFFDIMNFHYYSGQYVPEAMILRCFRPLRRVMGRFNKPVWITECGFPTAIRNDNQSNLYLDLLPQVYRMIRLAPGTATVAFIVDKKNGFDSTSSIDVDGNFYMFARRIGITLDDLKALDPGKVPLLIPVSGEDFPMEYFPYLIAYVRHGGTILLPCGAPFYYNLDLRSRKRTVVGNRYNELLHLDCLYWWSKQAEDIRAPRYVSWMKPASGINTNYTWERKDGGGTRFLTDDNLKGDDQLIPLVQAGDGNYSGTVVALYRLNSDLKGNVIVQTRLSNTANISEESQAKRLPRTFLLAFSYGVDKVFWYNFRAGEFSKEDSEAHFGIIHKDFSLKPAYLSYKTLIEMCPDGSTRPKLQVVDGVYRATWIRPDGKSVTAMWTENIEQQLKLRVKKNTHIFDYKGNELYPSSTIFYINPGVTYFVH